MQYGAGLNADALYGSTWEGLNFYNNFHQISDNAGLISLLNQYHVDYLILEENSVELEKRKIIEHISDSIAKFGTVSVRFIPDRIRFQNELLGNPDIGEGASWRINEGALKNIVNSGYIVTAYHSINQTISIKGGERFLNQVVARCPSQSAKVRTQVNWNDQDGKFITTDITDFDCSKEWSNYEQVVTAPINAAYAVVYGASNSNSPIEVKRISLRH